MYWKVEAQNKQLINNDQFEFGQNPKDLTLSLHGYTHLSNLEDISGKDFFSILKLLTSIRKYYRENPDIASLFDESIVTLIDKAEVNLQIKYFNGQFYPSKEEVLDTELIEHSLTVLKLYPAEEKDFGIALQNSNSNNKYGVVEYCYRCMEGLSRKILGNNKTLIDNKAELLKKISLNESWKKILANYIEYGNEYGRHASTKRHDLTEKEGEAYLFLTGLLVRVILK